MYVFLRSGKNTWTVGFYGPKGEWHAMSDHDSPGKAAGRIRYLNGGS